MRDRWCEQEKMKTWKIRREIREKWEVGPINNHRNYSPWAEKRGKKKEGGVGNEIY